MGRKSHYHEHRLQILALVDTASRSHGRPPSVRELAQETGVGVATMHLYLTRLAEEDLIEWRPASHRSLRCTPTAIQLVSSMALSQP